MITRYCYAAAIAPAARYGVVRDSTAACPDSFAEGRGRPSSLCSGVALVCIRLPNRNEQRATQQPVLRRHVCGCTRHPNASRDAVWQVLPIFLVDNTLNAFAKDQSIMANHDFHFSTTYQDVIDIFVLDEAYTNAQPRIDWFLRSDEGKTAVAYLTDVHKRPVGNPSTFKGKEKVVVVDSEEKEDVSLHADACEGVVGNYSTVKGKEKIVVLDSEDEEDAALGVEFIPLVTRRGVTTIARSMEQSSPRDSADTQAPKPPALDDDATLDRLHDVLLQMWSQLRGNTPEDSTTLHTFIHNSVDNLKNMINEYEVNVTDVQISELQEQIQCLRIEVTSLKVQLNRLNAIVARLNNIINKAVKFTADTLCNSVCRKL
ncbi:hypothetical protein GOP47_0028447 [Adiantum capillus-veneris]|nr:hypothetical protein GOP47_0028447 [Adiantum capillus-veneris]